MFPNISTEQLEREITELAGQIAADTCRWLLLVAEFDRREGHVEWGFHCCATWLSWRCSVTPRAAREQLRVARRLNELPLVREAFSRGELSYSKVRAITKVDDPKLEEDVLELARQATAAQLERLVRAFRGAASIDSAREADERRHLGYTWEDDGSLSFRGRLAPEEGALLVRALEAGRDMVNDGPAESPAAPLASNADAVVTMAESLLANGAAVRPAGERHEVVVHVDVETLATGDADGGGRCELEKGPSICAETARRLSCDGSTVAMREGADGALDVGRRTRAIPPAIRRALRSRDGGCRFPGCPNHRWVDGHHIRHWAQGGETALDNLVQLCRRHHRLLHEEGFVVEPRGDDGFLFRRPDGEPIPASPSLRMKHSAGRTRRVPGSAVAGEIPLPLSAGEPMDLDLAVGGLFARAGPDP